MPRAEQGTESEAAPGGKAPHGAGWSSQQQRELVSSCCLEEAMRAARAGSAYRALSRAFVSQAGRAAKGGST